MFVDTAKVKLQAGRGGNGAVSFRREIYIPKGGPDGGDGGKGGSIIFRADKDTNTLLNFRYNPELKAEDGKNGSGTRSAGRSGQDLIVEVPVGTLVYKLPPQAQDPSQTKVLLADLTVHGAEVIIAKGGDGGFGNAHFKSSTRQAPIIAELGEPGEAFTAQLELKLLADVGLVGLPNAGKSTFLSVVSNARPEIADYPFTTLAPQLGVATIDNQDILIADIPGLIEGAAEGKGLGHAFLRHIDRTTVLLHLIDAYAGDAGQNYQIIRQELAKYSNLASRPEVVALTKCEGLDPEIIDLQISSILKQNQNAQVFAISAVSQQGITEVLRELKQIINQTKASSPAQQTPPPAQVAQAQTQTSQNSKSLPVIQLSPKEYKNTWKVAKQDDGTYKVTGEKIEKFARRTDMDNYASLNRLRDIMKKLGIRAELTNQGATPESLIRIADKTFPLVEDY